MKKLVSTDFSVENWLILGGKWGMMIATADKYGCRTLPMRNWHFSASDISLARDFKKSDITYEELTHHADGFLTGIYPMDISSHVGHYLWGIDTFQPHCSENPQFHCRTLPMRNWHLLETGVTITCVCRTLPMRNWHPHNHSIPAHAHLHEQVGHYLWGIDTL